MTTHVLDTYSLKRYNLIMIPFILLTIVLLVYMLFNELPFFYFFIPVIVLFFIAQKVGENVYKAKVSISIMEDSINIKWINSYPILKEQDCNINFIDLKDYIFESRNEYYILKLTTKNNDIIRFYFKITQENSSSTMLFSNTFINAINIFNNKDNDPLNDINVGKTYWQTKRAKISAAILVIIILYGWIRILKVNKTDNATMLKMACATVLSFILVMKVVIACSAQNKK